MTWPIDLVVALFVMLGRHPALPFAALVIAPIAAAILLPAPRPGPSSRAVGISILSAIVLVVANLFFGDDLANRLIFLAGEDGQAIVTGKHGTNATYNYHDVVAYSMVLRTADGRSIPTTTRSDRFDIYPSGPKAFSDENGTFAVRYLRHLPQMFVFIVK